MTDAELALDKRRAAIENRRQVLALDSTLISAYHIARGLNELLRMLDSSGGRFSQEERAVLHTAHLHAHMTFDTLNRIVIDDGNQANRKNPD